MGTPASINASVEPHTLAIEEDPFELSTSETSLIVYGNSSSEGIIGSSALSANAYDLSSLLPGPRSTLVSPVL